MTDVIQYRTYEEGAELLREHLRNDIGITDEAINMIVKPYEDMMPNLLEVPTVCKHDLTSWQTLPSGAVQQRCQQCGLVAIHASIAPEAAAAMPLGRSYDPWDEQPDRPTVGWPARTARAATKRAARVTAMVPAVLLVDDTNSRKVRL